MSVRRPDRARRRDQRLPIVLLTVAGIAVVGMAIRWLPGDWTLKYRHDNPPPAQEAGASGRMAGTTTGRSIPAPPETSAAIDTSDWRLSRDGASTKIKDFDRHARQLRRQQIDILFEHGVLMLQQQHFDQARKALEGVLLLAPEMPEGHVNLGFAQIGLKQFDQARMSFQRAVALNPRQANGYYGLALCHEAQGDLPAARGAMRTFLHFSDGNSFYAIKARAALWEWQERPGDSSPGGARNEAGAVGDGQR